MAAHSRLRLSLIILPFVAFISLGLPDGLLGVAWPSLRTEFGRPLDSLGLLLIASMAGYLLSSAFSGFIIARIGIGKLLALSAAATGLSMLGCTAAPAWWLLMPLSVLAGLGAGAVDGGVNTFVAANFSGRLMQWLHASWGIGITLGPLIMTAGLKYSESWRAGYLLVGAGQLLLAVYFALTLGLWAEESAPVAGGERRITDYRTSWLETMRCPQVWLSILIFFCYTGVEAGVGSWTYTLLTESRGIMPQAAGLIAGSYWAAFTAGRILAGLFTERMPARIFLRAGIVTALLGALVLCWNPSAWASLLGVVVIGISLAPIFPALVSATEERVGAHRAANTIGIQISAACLGGALLPGAAGVLAEHLSLEAIPFFMACALLVLLILYGLAEKFNNKAAP